MRQRGTMPRCRTGLRNRYRGGRGSYSRNRKSVVTDYYGVWRDGRQMTPDKIRK